MRGEPRHHLSSKVLCWVALDRAVKLAPRLGRYAKVESWEKTRDEICEAILVRGWSDANGAYTQAFDSDHLDAAQLLMPIFGFLQATDERMRSTIDAIASELTGTDATFVICTFWLVCCFALAGELERAEALFDQVVGYANDLGLIAEEIDANTGEQLGNFPQAFSHVGLIIAASAIDRARDRLT